MKRFAQAHVISETRAKAEPGGKVQPADATLLIRSQCGGEAGDGVHRRRLAQTVEQFLQFLARDDLHPVARGIQLGLDRAGFIFRATAAEAGEHSHPIVKRQTRPHEPRAPYPNNRHLIDAVAINLDPLTAQIHEAGRRGLDLRPLSVSVSPSSV